MIELAEAVILAEELNTAISGKKIKDVVAAQSPHKFAFYYGDPSEYPLRLIGKVIGKTEVHGGIVVIHAEDTLLLINDGVALRYHGKNEKCPSKHQLFIEFEDLSSISASVQMYGGLYCCKEGEFDNDYFRAAYQKPSPLSLSFDKAYFDNIISMPGMDKLSVKAFLATEQRIPGLGNGILQDILYHAKLHPRRKIKTLGSKERDSLFDAVKSTFKEVVYLGGRDTEKDLFDHNGGYRTKLSKNTVGKPCPVCGSIIQKEAYLGGSIYYCGMCQKI